MSARLVGGKILGVTFRPFFRLHGLRYNQQFATGLLTTTLLHAVVGVCAPEDEEEVETSGLEYIFPPTNPAGIEAETSELIAMPRFSGGRTLWAYFVLTFSSRNSRGAVTLKGLRILG